MGRGGRVLVGDVGDFRVSGNVVVARSDATPLGLRFCGVFSRGSGVRRNPGL